MERNGRRIEVLTHHWLSHAPKFIADSIPGLRVIDLIDEDTRKWDKGKLSAISSLRTQMEILSIPLNHLDSRDTLIWMENKSQQFLVKWAYQLALRMHNRHVVEHSFARQDRTIWNQKAVGVGVVIQDDEGRLEAALSKKIPTPMGAVEAEAKAFETSLLFAMDVRVRDVILEGDLLVVYNALCNNSPPPTSIAAVV
ncbi:hypothetical protein SO802_006613 [Lithocarpus litseifolius]|uniref:RNase H type-1 domain-containing protein n=1 Tax=Lithocarpus litseifolius TaxID=425828 RepID=A0AAW2DLD8_9ROSI